MNERDLETEINSLINGLNGTKIGRTKISDSGNPGSTESYPIKKQITKLKKELCDTHNIFINAKNLLSNISFQNVDKNFETEVSSIGEKCQLMVDDQCEEDNFFESLCKIVHQSHNIPELHTMATAMKQLKSGISKMENNHLLLADLYEDVWKSVACSDADNVLLATQNTTGKTSAGKTLGAVLYHEDDYNI